MGPPTGNGIYGTTVTEDLAVEFAPYWWAAHPTLTFDRYYERSHVGENILRSLSFSVATTRISGEDAGVPRRGTALGFGVRCLLLPGKEAPGLEEKVDRLRALQNEALDLVPEIGEAPSREDEAKLEKALAAARAAGSEVEAADKQRVGWVIELAAGVAADFPDDDVDRADLTRVGLWITPAYHGGNPGSRFRHFTFIGVGRYLRDESRGGDRTLFDAGGRLVWKSGQLPVALSAEYVYRFVDGGGDTGRFAGVLEYRLSDNLALIASYGKNFEENFQGKEDLIAVAGVRFGWGRGAVVK
jgi:hypothetical protein